MRRTDDLQVAINRAYLLTCPIAMQIYCKRTSLHTKRVHSQYRFRTPIWPAPLIGHFYSWGLSVLAFKWTWGWGWPCFDTNMIYIIKQEGLHQNKVDSSLVCTCNWKTDNCLGTPTWRRWSHLNGGLVRYYLSLGGRTLIDVSQYFTGDNCQRRSRAKQK